MKKINPGYIVRRLLGTLILPVLMYLAMMILTYSNGKYFFGTWLMWKTVLADLALTFTCALGIGIQFKNGRFDFSGGSVMLLSAILAGNIAQNSGSNRWLFFALCLGCCLMLNFLVSLLYIWGRMPIIITTISAALLFEAVTCNIFNGAGITLVANISLKAFSSFPLALLPMGIACAVYSFYSHLTVTGRQSALLAQNQQAAVNIGINEKRNVIFSYLFGGIIFGCATSIYASTNILRGAFDSLSTVGALFTNILPVFVGLILSAFCPDVIGILMGSLTLSIMSFGFQAVFSAEIGAALTIMLTGLFLLLLNVIAGQSGHVAAMIRRLRTLKQTGA